MRRIEGAHASFAEPDGVRLYGSATALRAIAQALDEVDAELVLDSTPEEVVEAGPIDVLRLRTTDGEPVVLRASGIAVEIDGSSDARTVLADTLRNLAASPRMVGPVLRHVDLAYFPDHDFLGDASMWMTVYLVPEPIA